MHPDKTKKDDWKTVAEHLEKALECASNKKTKHDEETTIIVQTAIRGALVTIKKIQGDARAAY